MFTLLNDYELNYWIHDCIKTDRKKNVLPRSTQYVYVLLNSTSWVPVYFFKVLYVNNFFSIAIHDLKQEI